MDPFTFGGLDKHFAAARRPAAPKVSLASRNHIESMDTGLSSVSGAQAVIKEILARHSVVRLTLGHNNLGDAGCEELFGFLSSEAGRKHKIVQISLNSNDIGNRGLLAISRYLRDNVSLKELFLQNNEFVGNSDVSIVFALAINASHLETLTLTTNKCLGDTFVAHFLPVLDTPYLQEIHLSAIGLTHASAPYIVRHITSPRCRLRTLKVNGNQLRIRAARSIIRAARAANYTLHNLEMHANGLAEPDPDSDASPSDDEGEAKGTPKSWQDCETELKRILVRNSVLKRRVEKEALSLLRYARPLLLRPKSRATPSSISPCSDTCACAKVSPESLFASIGQPYAHPLVIASSPEPPTFQFTRLPTELQLHILSFLAPILSTAQRLRIFTYASSPTTLPTLLPCLSGGSGCIPDPASPQFGLGGTAPPSSIASSPLALGRSGGIVLRKRAGGGSMSGCASGKCMGAGNSVQCRRETERMSWLSEVRCTVFELEGEYTAVRHD